MAAAMPAIGLVRMRLNGSRKLLPCRTDKGGNSPPRKLRARVHSLIKAVSMHRDLTDTTHMLSP